MSKVTLSILAFLGLFVMKAMGQDVEMSQSHDSLPKSVVVVDGKELTPKQLERYKKQLRRDSIRATKRIWWSILGGPSYTPEASLGIGGAALASFRINPDDTLRNDRSFLPGLMSP